MHLLGEATASMALQGGPFKARCILLEELAVQLPPTTAAELDEPLNEEQSTRLPLGAPKVPGDELPWPSM